MCLYVLLIRLLLIHSLSYSKTVQKPSVTFVCKSTHMPVSQRGVDLLQTLSLGSHGGDVSVGAGAGTIRYRA